MAAQSGSSQTAGSEERSEASKDAVEMSDAECEKALQQFVAVTGTDEACAHFFLQDVNWQLQPALDRFFSYTTEAEGEADGAAAAKTSESAAAGEAASAKTSDEFVAAHRAQKFSLRVLSWNIDGLDSNSVGARFTAVCYILSVVAADVVFLQEMTPYLVRLIRKNLGGEYSILVATPDLPYFTVVLLKPNLNLISHKAFPYKRSGMGRSMQVVEATLNGRQLKLLNTHLESMKEHSDIRISQIQECFEQLKEWDDGKSVIIFGGDLNARNEEIGELPSGFADAWIAAGSNPKFKYTWDTMLNDNKSAGNARCRFDRIFFKSGGAFSKVNFSFEGKNRLRTSLCFPSDHWAVLVHFH